MHHTPGIEGSNHSVTILSVSRHSFWSKQTLLVQQSVHICNFSVMARIWQLSRIQVHE